MKLQNSFELHEILKIICSDKIFFFADKKKQSDFNHYCLCYCFCTVDTFSSLDFLFALYNMINSHKFFNNEEFVRT